jgi:hypothetical protein
MTLGAAMGLGYIAVKGLEKGQVLDILDIKESDRPAQLFSQAAVGVTSMGWVVVIAPDTGFPTPERLAAVSETAEAIGFWHSSAVMCATAYGYRGGELVWQIDHVAEEGIDHLEASGDLPSTFESVVAAARKAQADEPDPDVDHIFGIPESVVASLCGFHSEQDIDFQFMALQAPPKRPGLWARLFGKS